MNILMIMINIFNVSFYIMALYCLFKSTSTLFSIQLVEPNMKHSVRRQTCINDPRPMGSYPKTCQERNTLNLDIIGI